MTTYADAATKLGSKKGRFEKMLNLPDRAHQNTANRSLETINQKLDKLFALQELQKTVQGISDDGAGLPKKAIGGITYPGDPPLSMGYYMDNPQGYYTLLRMGVPQTSAGVTSPLDMLGPWKSPGMSNLTPGPTTNGSPFYAATSGSPIPKPGVSLPDTSMFAQTAPVVSSTPRASITGTPAIKTTTKKNLYPEFSSVATFPDTRLTVDPIQKITPIGPTGSAKDTSLPGGTVVTPITAGATPNGTGANGTGTDAGSWWSRGGNKTVASGVASLLNTVVKQIAINNMDKPEKPVYSPDIHLNKTKDISAQVSDIMRARRFTGRAADQLSSSQVGAALKQKAATDSVYALDKIRADATNYYGDVQNQESQINSQIGMYNTNLQNGYNNDLVEFANNKHAATANNITDLISNLQMAYKDQGANEMDLKKFQMLMAMYTNPTVRKQLEQLFPQLAQTNGQQIRTTGN